MKASVAVITLTCAALSSRAQAQGVTGLLARGRTIAFAGAIVPSLTPMASADFRLARERGGARRLAWSVGALGDELHRVATRASIRAPAGNLVVHATFERAAIRQLEEISNFERTGDHIAAQDGRLETGITAPLARGLWFATSARYDESLLADRRTGAGELLLGAGWKEIRGFDAVIESGVVTFARADASDTERNPYGRLAIRTPVIRYGLGLVAGMTWNELGVHRARPLNAAGAIRWTGWDGHVATMAGGEYSPYGFTDAALELQLRTTRFALGTRASRQAPGTNSLQLWLGSGG